MQTYQELLKKAYKEVKVVETGKDRFEMPKVEGQVSGKNTIITNINVIASYLRRPMEHLSKFLQKELAVPGRIEKDRLILYTRLNSKKVNEKIDFYANNFVICPVCKKPDTEIQTEKGIKIKNCLACGAKSSIKYSI